MLRSFCELDSEINSFDIYCVFSFFFWYYVKVKAQWGFLQLSSSLILMPSHPFIILGVEAIKATSLSYCRMCVFFSCVTTGYNLQPSFCLILVVWYSLNLVLFIYYCISNIANHFCNLRSISRRSTNLKIVW